MLEPSTAVKRSCPTSDEVGAMKSSTRAVITGPIFHVKGPDAKYHTFQFNPRQTILQLKVEIFNKIKMPVDIQSLRFTEQVLKDERSIGSYSIKESSTVECFAVQRGGSDSEEVEEQLTIGGLKYRKYVQSLEAMTYMMTSENKVRTPIRRQFELHANIELAEGSECQRASL
jgi:hypothetical protein